MRNTLLACIEEKIELLLGRECYGGLELYSSIDITAFVLVFPLRDDTEKQGFLETTEGDFVLLMLAGFWYTGWHKWRVGGR